MFTIQEIKPLFTGVVTTAHRYVGDQHDRTAGGLIIDTRKLDGMLNPYQWVISVGDMVTDVKPGDIVKLNFKRYKMVNHPRGSVEENVETDDNMNVSYSIPSIELDGRGECLMVQNNDIDFVVTKYSGVEGGGLLQ